MQNFELEKLKYLNKFIQLIKSVTAVQGHFQVENVFFSDTFLYSFFSINEFLFSSRHIASDFLLEII